MSQELMPCQFSCEKCGHADVNRIFRATSSTWPIEAYGKARNKFAHAEAYLATARCDHIDHKCRCCGYSWQTRPMSKRKKKSPTAQAVAVDDAMVRRALACRPYPDDRYDDETISEMLCRLPQEKRAGAVRAALQAALEGR